MVMIKEIDLQLGMVKMISLGKKVNLIGMETITKIGDRVTGTIIVNLMTTIRGKVKKAVVNNLMAEEISTTNHTSRIIIIISMEEITEESRVLIITKVIIGNIISLIMVVIM